MPCWKISNNACNTANFYMCICVWECQTIWQTFWYVLYGPKTTQSSGSNLCNVWWGSVSKKEPFSLATLMAEIDKWNSWLSKIKRIGSSFKGLLHVIQCIMQSTKNLSFDQTVGFSPPIEAVGAPFDMWFLKCTLGNINIGGTCLPMTFRATVIVTFSPLPFLKSHSLLAWFP